LYVLPDGYHEGIELMFVYISSVRQERNTAINQTEEILLKEREFELE
jgi:hypothetical protein